jgi:alpha-mannosidase
LLFHSGDCKAANVVRQVIEALHPILPVFPNSACLPHQRQLAELNSFMNLSPATVQFSAFYRDRGTYLVRVWESAGSRAVVSLELPFQLTRVKEVDFNGNTLRKPISVSGKTVRFEIAPWEIVTLSII